MRGLTTALALIAALALVPVASAKPDPEGPGEGNPPVVIQLLNVSDWHAQLDPNRGVGGAAVISSYWKADREANPNTLTFTAGDAYGASPPLSGFFEEEPAVKAMNLMGFDADTFGNHNFDRGIDHLQQMIDLAEFQYVSANLENRDDNLSGVKDFEIFEVAGVKIGVVGITNPEAPNLVFPGSFGTIEVTDPVAAAIEARDAARAAGAQVLIALTHLGITGSDAAGNPVGPLVDFANGVTGYDVIYGDHTDRRFEATINGALVIENRSKGATYSRTALKVLNHKHPSEFEIIQKKNEFVVPRAADVTPDPAIVEMLAPYRAALSEVFDVQIGTATDEFPRGGNIERSGEVAIGNLVTDSLRAEYGSQLALTNGGGIRAPLPSSYEPQDTSLRRTSEGYAAGPPYDLVVGDAFAVLPFGNSVVTRTVTGAQLWAALENGVSQITADGTGSDGRFPQISGFRFTFDYSNAPGSRVLSVELEDGTAIPADGTTYTLATNDFLNAGGDGYSMFADGEGVTREVMADVLLEYIRAEEEVSPVIDGRITKLP